MGEVWVEYLFRGVCDESSTQGALGEPYSGPKSMDNIAYGISGSLGIGVIGVKGFELEVDTVLAFCQNNASAKQSTEFGKYFLKLKNWGLIVVLHPNAYLN